MLFFPSSAIAANDNVFLDKNQNWKDKNPILTFPLGGEGINDMPKAGLEPARLAPQTPQACVYTNFTTPANFVSALDRNFIEDL